MKHIVLLSLLFPIIVFGQHFSTTRFEVKPFPEVPAKHESVIKLLNSSADFQSLNAEQREWFYWTNYSRLNPRAFWDSVVSPVLKTYPNLVSSYSASLKADLYAAKPLPLITPNKTLEQLAQAHVNGLASKKANPSHTSINGKTFQQRMIDAQVNRCAAENISFGPSNAVMALVLLYIDENLPDLGHRKNLLSPGYTQMGIGIANYPNNMVMIIQDLACDQPL